MLCIDRVVFFYYKSFTLETNIVPLHKKTLAVGTLKSILNQANISVDEFVMNL